MAWCDYCYGLGWIECECGGDQCVCGQQELPCPVCYGEPEDDDGPCEDDPTMEER